MPKRKTATVAPTRAIVRAPQRGNIEVLDNTGKIVDAIVRAAADPRVKVEKLERLEAMQKRMEERAAKIAFDNALAEVQAEIPEISRKGKITIRKKNPQTGERTGPIEQLTPYSTWEDIMEVVRPILHKYSFSLSFRTPVDPNGKISVTAILARRGHREESTLSYQHDSTGSKNAAQAITSSVTYGKRVTGCALLNIVTRGEDDDGMRSAMLEKVSPAQLEELLMMAEEAGANKAAFCALMKVDSFPDIPQMRFEEARAQLKRKIDKKAREAAKAAASDFPGDRPMPKTEPPPNEWRP